MKQYIAYQAQHQHGAFDMTSFKYLLHTYIAGERIQFDYFFPNGLDQPPPSFLLPQKLAKKKLDQMKARKSYPLEIESPFWERFHGTQRLRISKVIEHDHPLIRYPIATT